MSYAEYREKLTALRDKITKLDSYSRNISRYKREAKSLIFTPDVIAKWTNWANKFNMANNTKIGLPTNAALKFAELYADLSAIDNAFFLGELPGSASLMLRYLYPNANIKISSPLPAQNLFSGNDFLPDTYDLVGSPIWYPHKTALIDDPNFLEQIMDDPDIPAGWLISDIGVAGEAEQDVIQRKVAKSFLKIIRHNTNGIGKDGIIMKLYDFDDDEMMSTVHELSRYFAEFAMVKTQGSPIANDEVMVLMNTDKFNTSIPELHVPGTIFNTPTTKGIDIVEIRKMRAIIREKTKQFITTTILSGQWLAGYILTSPLQVEPSSS